MVADLGPEARERRRRATPLGTEGTAWDVGWGALYLASDESRWVTGQVLVIDGGLTCTSEGGSAASEGGFASLGEGATPPHTPRPTAPRA
jgi:Enoyl-(Acyl carrier protein) reductase